MWSKAFTSCVISARNSIANCARILKLTSNGIHIKTREREKKWHSNIAMLSVDA